MPSMPWFRLYSRIIDDDKMRLLAFEDRWHFVALCCLKSEGVLDEKDTSLKMRKIAVKMGLQTREVEEVGRRLFEVGLVDKKLNPKKWDDLQFKSDSSKDRVSAYRKRKKSNCNGDVTLQGSYSNAGETVQDKDKDKDKDKNIKKTAFKKPTVKDISEYCLQRKNSVDPQRFFDHYETADWHRGKTKIKDWKACVRTWEKKSFSSEVGEVMSWT